jgi:hypothetical protein
LPVSLVAQTRDSAVASASGLPQGAVGRLLGVDCAKSLVVVVGPVGCHDHRVVVKSIVRKGALLHSALVAKPAAAGAAKRQETPPYRLLLVLPKKRFARQYPTHADTRVARA